MVGIDKNTFVSCIKAIQEGLEKRNKFDDALCAISDSWFVCNIGDEWLTTLISLLEKLLDDESKPIYGSMLSWWLFDDTDKKIWWEADGQKFEKDLTTPEALYDYLVEKAS